MSIDPTSALLSGDASGCWILRNMQRGTVMWPAATGRRPHGNEANEETEVIDEMISVSSLAFFAAPCGRLWLGMGVGER